MDKLSPEQIKFYHDKGYLVIGQLIDFESLYTYKKRFLQICNGLVPKGTMTIAKEPKLKESSNNPEDYVNKIQDFLCDDVLVTYVEDPRLFRIVSQFIGDDIRGMHSMLINKPPGTDEHPPHQDLYYFPFRPADKIIASWTAIDVVTYENGCLYVVPGSHKQQKLYAHDYTSIDNKMYHGILDPTAALETDRVHLEMNPGDTVFFHPYLIHGSRPNVSKNYRKSISCHFASSDVTYIDVQGTVQDVIAKEVVQEAKRRGFEASFADVWKYKSVPIKPIKSHL
ncbi:unnamed protein product [Chilo suppressalis]|uniref:phytanoyl-CoA dioxygenase n=1 Tax=Chilo suppressalis TaxID=168631 RepID=A0ABN8B8I1_CHISP|nr:unnamed protein product [Chilo suppressalis]